MSTSQPIDISVVIPLYNSAEILPELLSRLIPQLEPMTDRYEVILVNDGSADDTWAVATQQIEQYRQVTGIDLMRNHGQHNALLAGIRAARYDYCLTMDDDLQHPPEEIPKLLAIMDDQCDVVYGTPRTAKYNLARRFASFTTKLVLKSSMGVDVAQRISSFRLFRTKLRDAFAQYKGSFVNIDVLLTWATVRFKAADVTHAERTIGKSGYTLRTMIAHAMNMITGFSALPLQVASIFGLLMAGFGFLILMFVIGRYLLEGNPVPGWPFLASIIAIFSGAQMLFLGIIGEYLWRVHFRVMDKPPYTIRAQHRATPVENELPVPATNGLDDSSAVTPLADRRDGE